MLNTCQTSEESVISTIPGYTGARLLLVEDNEINREFAVELLRSMNVEVDEVVNGEKAVQRVQQQTYDGVLMDIQMPVMDGLEATRQIRSLAQRPGGEYFARLPIIAMTAMATVDDVEKCRQAGMSDYISKPIWPERLSAILEQWIHIKQDNSQNILSNIASIPADLLTLTSMDVKEGVRRIGGNVDVYRKQLFRFRDHYANAVQELQRLIVEENLVFAEFYCHGIKGVSGNLGAKSLFMAVTDVDNTLKNNQVPTKEQLDLIQKLLQQSITEINTLNTKVASASTTKLRGDELLAKLSALKLLLEHDLGACALLLDDLCAGVVGTDIEAAVLEITDKIDVFEIDEAQLDINTLIERLSK